MYNSKNRNSFINNDIGGNDGIMSSFLNNSTSGRGGGGGGNCLNKKDNSMNRMLSKINESQEENNKGEVTLEKTNENVSINGGRIFEETVIKIAVPIVIMIISKKLRVRIMLIILIGQKKETKGREAV